MKGTILESLDPLQYTLPPNTFTDIAAQKLGIQINYARLQRPQRAKNTPSSYYRHSAIRLYSS